MPFLSWIRWIKRIKNNSQAWPIQTWLMLLACCSVLPFAVLGLWQLHVGNVKFQETQHEKLQIIARNIASNIEVQTKEFNLLAEVTSNEIGTGVSDKFNGVFSSFNPVQYMRLHPQITDMEFRDQGNKLLYHFLSENKPNLEKEAWISGNKESKTFAISDAISDPENKTIEIVVSHPIFKNNQMIGRVILTLNLSKLNERILNVDSTNDVFVLDRNDRIIAHSPLSETTTAHASIYAADAFKKDTWKINSEAEIFQYGGRIYKRQVEPHLGWQILVGISEREMNDFIQKRYTTAFLYFTATLILALFLAWHFSEKIASPIRQLANITNTIARGGAAQMANDGPREIREVALQFNQMLEQLTEKREEHNALTRHYATILFNARDILLLIDRSGRLIEANNAAIAAYGYTQSELLTMNIRQLFASDQNPELIEHWLTPSNQFSPLFEARHLHRDGSSFPIEISANTIDIEGKHYRQCFIRDISVRKQLEQTIANRTRALEALNTCNQVLSKAKTLDELMHGICNVFVEKTGYKMAWIGVAEFNQDKRVRPVIKSGEENAYLSQLNISWHDNEFGHGPTGTAIRTQKTVVARDIRHDPNFVQWRDAAEKNGYQSSIALPIIIADTAFGALNIYSVEANSFAEDEIKLLEELARNLANGIDLLQTHDMRNRLVTELTLSEKRFRSLIELSPIGICTCVDEKIVYANPRLAEILGYTTEQLHNMPIFDLIVPEDRNLAEMAMERLEANGYTGNYTLRCRRKDGIEIEIGLQQVVAEFEGVTSILGMAQDISERMRANAEIEHYIKLLEHATEATLEAVSTIVEQRDPYTAGHEKRVGILAADIGTAMGLSDHVIKGLRLTGIVHDVGKVGVPAEILAKPTRLTSIEMALVREHAQAGYEILKNVQFPWPIAEVVYQHHERMDGSGYPRGLKGDQILLEARIMAVADVVESMTSHRPYRPGLGLEAALFEIQKNRGIIYDVSVVDSCLKMFQEDGYSLPV